MTAVLEAPPVKGKDVLERESDEPISFLHIEGMDNNEVATQPHPDIVAEHDTFIKMSSDSDTI